MKVAMIGAGSVVFSKNLTGDFLQYPEFADATFSYMDIDAERLEVGANLCRKVGKALNVNPKIEATMDRREAIKDADFVICMVQIGGFDSTLVDFEIPRKYGLNFTIADTTGPGGLFRALRTFPLMRDMAGDIMDVANPGCWLLNYSNPMSMNMQSLYRTTPGIKAVGLCHSVQGTFNQRMRDIDVDPEQASFLCAGINHMAFYLKAEKDGQDLYPKLFAVADEKIARNADSVRYELMKRLGYAVTESSEHNAEYCAHFIPHAGYVDRFKVPIDEYLRRCDGIVDEFERMIDFSKNDEPITVKKSHEYGSIIAHSIATGEPSVVYGNMPNNGAISNLPDTAIAEVPTLVDKNGCQFTTVGEIPPQLVGYMMPHVTQHELFIRAAMEGRRDHVYQACMMDPLTAASVPTDKIVEMCDELIAAHGFIKDGGTLPDLDVKKTLVPTSGKTFTPPTAKQLRESWEAAKRHTSDEDVLETWQVAGPLPADAADAVQQRYLEAGKLAPADGTWHPVSAEESGFVKPAAITSRLSASVNGHAAHLLYAEIDSVHDREAPLRLQTARRRPVTVWLNGKQVYHGSGETFIVPLRQGVNSLLVRQNEPEEFALYVRKANF